MALRKVSLQEIIDTLPECPAHGYLYRKDVPTTADYCSVGWILHLAGVPDSLMLYRGATLSSLWMKDETLPSRYIETLMAFVIQDAIPSDFTEKMVSCNDSGDPETRRVRVVEYLTANLPIGAV